MSQDLGLGGISIGGRGINLDLLRVCETLENSSTNDEDRGNQIVFVNSITH